MLKAKASEKNFDWFYFLVTTLAAYKNNFMFFDLAGFPEAELKAEIEALEGLINEFIEVGEL